MSRKIFFTALEISLIGNATYKVPQGLRYNLERYHIVYQSNENISGSEIKTGWIFPLENLWGTSLVIAILHLSILEMNSSVKSTVHSIRQ